MSESAALLEEGLQHENEGRIAEAMETYRQVLALEPDNARALLLRGLALLRDTEDYEQALADFERACELDATACQCESDSDLGKRIDWALKVFEWEAEVDPNSAQVHLMLARALKAFGRPDRAKLSVEMVLQLHPDNWEASHLSARLAMIQGRYEAAVKDLQQLVRGRSNEPGLQYELGLAYDRMGSGGPAQRHFEKACALDPVVPQYRLALADLALRQGRLPNAVQGFESVLKLQEGHPRALLGLARCHRAQYQFDQAIERYQQALQAMPGEPEAERELAEVQLQVGQPQTALSSLTRVAEAEPDNAEGWLAVARAAEEGENLSRAVDAYQRALRLDESNHAAWARLAQVQARGQQIEDALHSLTRAATLEPTEVAYPMASIDLLLRSGQRDQARVHLFRAAALHTASFDLQMQAGLQFMELGQFEPAWRALSAAVRLRPDQALAQWALGQVFLRQQKLDEAFACFRAALKLDPRQLGTLLGMAQVCRLRGQLDLAQDFVEQAAELQPNAPPLLEEMAHQAAAQGQVAGVKALVARLLSVGADPQRLWPVLEGWARALASPEPLEPFCQCYPHFALAGQLAAELSAVAPAGSEEELESGEEVLEEVEYVEELESGEEVLEVVSEEGEVLEEIEQEEEPLEIVEEEHVLAESEGEVLEVVEEEFLEEEEEVEPALEVVEEEVRVLEQAPPVPRPAPLPGASAGDFSPFPTWSPEPELPAAQPQQEVSPFPQRPAPVETPAGELPDLPESLPLPVLEPAQVPPPSEMAQTEAAESAREATAAEEAVNIPAEQAETAEETIAKQTREPETAPEAIVAAPAQEPATEATAAQAQEAEPAEDAIVAAQAQEAATQVTAAQIPEAEAAEEAIDAAQAPVAAAEAITRHAEEPEQAEEPETAPEAILEQAREPETGPEALAGQAETAPEAIAEQTEELETAEEAISELAPEPETCEEALSEQDQELERAEEAMAEVAASAEEAREEEPPSSRAPLRHPSQESEEGPVPQDDWSQDDLYLPDSPEPVEQLGPRHQLGRAHQKAFELPSRRGRQQADQTATLRELYRLEEAASEAGLWAGMTSSLAALELARAWLVAAPSSHPVREFFQSHSLDLAAALEEAGALEEAVYILDNCLELVDDAAVRIKLASLCAEQALERGARGRHPEAVRLAQRRVELLPDGTEASELRDECLRQWAEAGPVGAELRAFQRAQKRAGLNLVVSANPRPPRPEEENEPPLPTASADELRAQLLESPENSSLARQLESLLAPEQRVAFFRDLVSQKPDAVAFLVALAQAYEAAGQSQLAVVQFQKALKLGASPEVAEQLAGIYERLGKPKLAAKVPSSWVPLPRWPSNWPASTSGWVNPSWPPKCAKARASQDRLPAQDWPDRARRPACAPPHWFALWPGGDLSSGPDPRDQRPPPQGRSRRAGAPGGGFGRGKLSLSGDRRPHLARHPPLPRVSAPRGGQLQHLRDQQSPLVRPGRPLL
ncbi:tetratricopeptide repeat protein, partial [bacterium CPR1]|nr:tetratricopeptide repeat protein [bacterium CPR1]